MLALARHGPLAARYTRLCDRSFFNLSGFNASSDAGQSSGVTRYKESKVLPYSQRQMYDVVKDVRSYPTFLPYCLGAVVSSTQELANRDLLMLATLAVGISPFKVSYESRVTCRPYEFVKAEAADTSSSPFYQLETTWRFQPTGASATSESHDTLVSIDLSYALKDPIQSRLLGSMFVTLSKDMIDAFERRCNGVYGVRV